MTEIWLLALLVGLLLMILLFSGQMVGMALATSGVIILAFMVGGGQVAMVGRLQYNMANNFVLGCVPLFILMGFILIRSGLTDIIYEAFSPLVSVVPGGLLHTNIVAGSFFGAMCGTSVAGTAAVGVVAISQLQKRGYDKELSYGSLAAGGTMSALIPPSLALIVYGAWVGESIGALFIAGVLPGIIMTIFFMIYIGIRALINPKVAKKETVSREQLLTGLVHVLPILAIILVVLGSIYLGVATPTEASAIGVVSAIILSAAYRRLSWKVLKQAGLETASITCMVMILVVGAQFFAMGMSMLGIPQAITDWLLVLKLHRMVVMISIMVLYVILGMFMEGTAIFLMTLPLTYPAAMGLGFDSVWFGILVTILIQIGLLTPPLGMDVYIIHQLSGEKDMWITFRGATPFMLIMGLVVVLLFVFPGIATWLPGIMMR
jgi:C4-dicarboxylate transporter DctM subunit